MLFFDVSRFNYEKGSFGILGQSNRPDIDDNKSRMRLSRAHTYMDRSKKEGQITWDGFVTQTKTACRYRQMCCPYWVRESNKSSLVSDGQTLLNDGSLSRVAKACSLISGLVYSSLWPRKENIAIKGIKRSFYESHKMPDFKALRARGNPICRSHCITRVVATRNIRGDIGHW